MTEENVAEYIEKMKDKPKKQIHHPGYKPKWHWNVDPEDLPWLAGAITYIILLILAVLGVLK